LREWGITHGREGAGNVKTKVRPKKLIQRAEGKKNNMTTQICCRNTQIFCGEESTKEKQKKEKNCVEKQSAEQFVSEESYLKREKSLYKE